MTLYHALGDDRKYFPTEDYGLAQGSCLSPLLCNLALARFDGQMNRMGCRCIRFVDDFVLFASDRRRAHAAFRAGQQELSTLGLSAYAAGSSDKAEEGSTKTDTLSFLGCQIQRDVIRPTRANCKILLNKVEGALADNRVPLGQAITDANRLLVGWGNSFGFCNDEQVFKNLDREVQRRAAQFLKCRMERLHRTDTTAWLTLIGLKPLVHRQRSSGNSAAKDRQQHGMDSIRETGTQTLLPFN